MGYLLYFGWFIQALNFLGLIETEPNDPESRAYRDAHAALEVLKRELVGSEIVAIGENCVRYRRADQGDIVLSLEGEDLIKTCGRLTETVSTLGSQGELRFQTRAKSLEVSIKAVATDEDECAEHQIQATLSIARQPRTETSDPAQDPREPQVIS